MCLEEFIMKNSLKITVLGCVSVFVSSIACSSEFDVWKNLSYYHSQGYLEDLRGEYSEQKVLRYSVDEERPVALENSVECSNPWYEIYKKKYSKKVGFEVPENFVLQNGSALSFSGNGALSDLIRSASKFNDIPNSLDLSHSELGISESPMFIFDLTKERMKPRMGFPRLSEIEGNKILNELLKYHRPLISLTHDSGEVKAFSAGEDGCLRICDLQNLILNYDGNIYMRPINEGLVTREQTRRFLTEKLGTPYENLATFSEIRNSFQGKNVTLDSSRMFCSEAVSYFYAHYTDIVLNRLPNNILPENLCSKAGRVGDVLYDYAGKEVPLKIVKLPNGDDTGIDAELNCLDKFLGCFCCCKCK